MQFHKALRVWGSDELWDVYRRARKEGLEGVQELHVEPLARVLQIDNSALLMLLDVLSSDGQHVPLIWALTIIALFSGSPCDDKIKFLACIHDSTGQGKLNSDDFNSMLTNLRTVLDSLFGVARSRAMVSEAISGYPVYSQRAWTSSDDLLVLFEPIRRYYESLPWADVSHRRKKTGDDSCNKLSDSVKEAFMIEYRKHRKSQTNEHHIETPVVEMPPEKVIESQYELKVDGPPVLETNLDSPRIAKNPIEDESKPQKQTESAAEELVQLRALLAKIESRRNQLSVCHFSCAAVASDLHATEFIQAHPDIA